MNSQFEIGLSTIAKHLFAISRIFESFKLNHAVSLFRILVSKSFSVDIVELFNWSDALVFIYSASFAVINLPNSNGSLYLGNNAINKTTKNDASKRKRIIYYTPGLIFLYSSNRRWTPRCTELAAISRSSAAVNSSRSSPEMVIKHPSSIASAAVLAVCVNERTRKLPGETLVRPARYALRRINSHFLHRDPMSPSGLSLFTPCSSRLPHCLHIFLLFSIVITQI